MKEIILSNQDLHKLAIPSNKKIIDSAKQADTIFRPAYHGTEVMM